MFYMAIFRFCLGTANCSNEWSHARWAHLRSIFGRTGLDAEVIVFVPSVVMVTYLERFSQLLFVPLINATFLYPPRRRFIKKGHLCARVKHGSGPPSPGEISWVQSWSGKVKCKSWQAFLGLLSPTLVLPPCPPSQSDSGLREGQLKVTFLLKDAGQI